MSAVIAALSGRGRGKPIKTVSHLCKILCIEELQATSLYQQWLFYVVRGPQDKQPVYWKHLAYGRCGDVLFVRDVNGHIVGGIIADGVHCLRANSTKRPRIAASEEYEVAYDADTLVPLSQLVHCLKTRPVKNGPLLNRWTSAVAMPKSFLVWYFRSVITGALPTPNVVPPGIRQIIWPRLASTGKLLGGGAWQWSDSSRMLTANFESGGEIGHRLVATRQCILERGRIFATGDQFCDAIEPAFLQWVRNKIIKASEVTDRGSNLDVVAGIGPANAQFIGSIRQSVNRRQGIGLSATPHIPKAPLCVQGVTGQGVEFKNGLRWQLAQIVVDFEQCLRTTIRPDVMAAIAEVLRASGQSTDRIVAFSRAVESFRRRTTTTWPCVSRVAGRTELFCPRLTPGTSPEQAVQECVRDQCAQVQSTPTDRLTPGTIWALSRR